MKLMQLAAGCLLVCHLPASAAVVNASLTFKADVEELLFGENWIAGGGISLSGLDLEPSTSVSTLSSASTAFTIEQEIVPVSAFSRRNITYYQYSTEVTVPKIKGESAEARFVLPNEEWTAIGSMFTDDIGGNFNALSAIVDLSASGTGRAFVEFDLLFTGSDIYSGEQVSFYRSFRKGVYGDSFNSVINLSGLPLVSFSIFARGMTIEAYAPAVPEPSTWIQFILGFGILGGTLRFRRAKQRILQGV